MRPARKGPENRALGRGFDAPRAASMRPARKGPENRQAAEPLLRRIAELQ